MSFFNQVKPNDPFTPSASKENAVANLLNAMPGTGAVRVAKSPTDFCLLTIVNGTGDALRQGSPVELTGAFTALAAESKCDGYAFLARTPSPAASGKSKVIGIAMQTLEKNAIGNAVFLGVCPARVIVNSKDDEYAALNGDGRLESGAIGDVRLLWIPAELAVKDEDDDEDDGATVCIVRLGGDAAHYQGSFAVTQKDGLLNVSGGFLNRNGDFLTVAETKEIEPASGYLCVCSTIEGEDDEEPKWTEVEVKFSSPAADAYPVAEIVQKNERLEIRQLPVSVAIIMLVKTCPLAEF